MKRIEAIHMWTPTIGANAGKLWTIISNNGEISLPGLRKLSKLDDKHLYLALGWLAREDKVKFAVERTQTLVALK
jgi:hypothetical protein